MSRQFLVAFPLLLSLLAAADARAQWNAQSLFTEDGVEIGVDTRVFALFAMFNGIGYDVDDRVGPAPLHRPLYATARQKLRQQMGRRGTAQKALEDVLAKQPKPISDYIAAALELGPAPGFEAKGASPLAQAISGPLSDWFNDEGGAALLRIVAEELKPTQKRLLPSLDKSIKATTKLIRLGDTQDQLLDDSGAVGRVVVVVNELDRHGSLQVVTRGDVSYVIVGALDPGKDANTDEVVVNAATLAYARTLVVREAAKVAAGTIAELGSKLDPKLDDKAAATELLACAFMKKVRGAATPCAHSPLYKQAAADEALAAMAPRVDAYAGTTAALSVALADILAPLPPATPPADAPPADGGKGGGKGGGKKGK